MKYIDLYSGEKGNSIRYLSVALRSNEMVKTKQGRRDRYTFAGASYFNLMVESGLYTTDVEEIKDRVEKVNLKDILTQKLI